MKLLNLPTDCLLYLFQSSFTLQELLYLRSICSVLCNLIEGVHCIGSRDRKTLKLFSSLRDVRLYTTQLFRYSLEHIHELRLHPRGTANDDLIVHRPEHFGPEVIAKLLRLLPNVEHLVIYFGRNLITFKYDTVLRVLECWKEYSTRPLTGLSLFGLFETDPNESELRRHFPHQLMELINPMSPNLRTLHLAVQCLFDNATFVIVDREQTYVKQQVTFAPELLCRLKRYFCNKFNLLDSVIPLLARSSQLTELGFDFANSQPDGSYGAALNTTCSTIPQLTRLRFNNDFTYFSRLVNSITHVQALDLFNSLRTESLSDVLVPQMAAQLPNLTQLSLTWFDFSILETNQHFVTQAPVLDRISRLKLVQSHYPDRSRNRLKCPTALFRALVRIFPNTHQLTLCLGHVFHDESSTVQPIEPTLHLSPFRMLTRFQYSVTLGLTGDAVHFLLRDHHHRNSREGSMDQGSKGQSMDQIELGYNGAQLWVKVDSDSWQTNTPIKCVRQTNDLVPLLHQ